MVCVVLVFVGWLFRFCVLLEVMMSLIVLGILVLLVCGLAWLGWCCSSVVVLVLILVGVVVVGDGLFIGWMFDWL